MAAENHNPPKERDHSESPVSNIQALTRPHRRNSLLEMDTGDVERACA